MCMSQEAISPVSVTVPAWYWVMLPAGVPVLHVTSLALCAWLSACPSPSHVAAIRLFSVAEFVSVVCSFIWILLDSTYKLNQMYLSFSVWVHWAWRLPGPSMFLQVAGSHSFSWPSGSTGHMHHVSAHSSSMGTRAALAPWLSSVLRKRRDARVCLN